MIVFDLICGEAAHPFEGWFASSDEYEHQKSTGMLVCPVCDSSNITKALMAPNIGIKGSQRSKLEPSNASSAPNTNMSSEASETSAVQVPAEYKELLGKLATAQSEILEKSEWVGDSFSEEAKAMYYGDSEEKPIHGTATSEEVVEMEEEGIELTPLPFPVAPPETQN